MNVAESIERQGAIATALMTLFALADRAGPEGGLVLDEAETDDLILSAEAARAAIGWPEGEG